MGIGDYFKTGEFWSTLEQTIKKLKKKSKQNSRHIRDLENTNLILLEKIENLTIALNNLKADQKDIDRKIWDIKNEKLIYADYKNKKKLKFENKTLSSK